MCPQPGAGSTHTGRPASSSSRSRSSIACCSCCSPRRASWCRCGTASTATRTASSALCQRLMAEPHARGVWAAVQAMSRLAHAGCLADDLRVTAFNGRLFAPARTPLAERRRVPDAAAARAVLSLGTTPTRKAAGRIAFHDLGVEQLGAVYERVLEYEPVRCSRAACRCRPRQPSARRPAASTRRARSPTSSSAARWARWSRACRPPASSSCASSIRRWAAAHSWWRRAAISPNAPSRRWWRRANGRRAR